MQAISGNPRDGSPRGREGKGTVPDTTLLRHEIKCIVDSSTARKSLPDRTYTSRLLGTNCPSIEEYFYHVDADLVRIVALNPGMTVWQIHEEYMPIHSERHGHGKPHFQLSKKRLWILYLRHILQRSDGRYFLHQKHEREIRQAINGREVTR